MAKLVLVTKKNEIKDGEARTFTVGDLRLAICRVGEEYFALEDLCTHDDGPLGEGCLAGYEIECPRHGARFDVRDGHVTRMPAATPVDVYRVKVTGEDVLVEIEED
jgi:3-phenylpropionate/trans-cinnamate dioxygenase ferredoxin subunit